MIRRLTSNVCTVVAAFFAVLAVLALNACSGGGSGGSGAATGVLSQATVTVNGVQRSYYYYLPSNLTTLQGLDAKGVRFVISFHDQGQNGATNADVTRWQELGETNGFAVIFPNAVNGTWNTTLDASGNNEAAFVNAAWAAIRSATNLSDANAVYLTGIGTGASVAHQIAMIAPNVTQIPVISAVAGIRGVANSAVFSLPTTSFVFTPTTPYSWGTITASASTPLGASLPPTSMAAWLITDSTTTLVTQQADYWKTLNNVSATPTTTTDSYFSTSIYTNATNTFKQVRQSTFTSSSSISGKALSQYIWTNMFNKVLRFKDDDRVNGSLHEAKTIADMGLIDTTYTFSAAAGGDRRFLTYVPTTYASLTSATTGSVPLLLNFHGVKGSARWQALNTEFYKTAEKYGFIAVFPQGLGATWSTSISTYPTINTDVQYVLELISYLKTLYQIDKTRIYITGVSQGAAFTNRVIVQYPELFASAAPCYSGHLSASTYNNYTQYPDIRTDVALPIWQCRGGTEPDSAYPGGLSAQEAARRFWRVVVNGYTDMGTGTGAEDSATPTSTETRDPDSRKHIKIFSGGRAEYRFQVTDYNPHFWHPDQAELMWTEMFSKYRRNADRSLTYTP